MVSRILTIFLLINLNLQLSYADEPVQCRSSKLYSYIDYIVNKVKIYHPSDITLSKIVAAAVDEKVDENLFQNNSENFEKWRKGIKLSKNKSKLLSKRGDEFKDLIWKLAHHQMNPDYFLKEWTSNAFDSYGYLPKLTGSLTKEEKRVELSYKIDKKSGGVVQVRDFGAGMDLDDIFKKLLIPGQSSNPKLLKEMSREALQNVTGQFGMGFLVALSQLKDPCDELVIFTRKRGQDVVAKVVIKLSPKKENDYLIDVTTTEDYKTPYGTTVIMQSKELGIDNKAKKIVEEMTLPFFECQARGVLIVQGERKGGDCTNVCVDESKKVCFAYANSPKTNGKDEGKHQVVLRVSDVKIKELNSPPFNTYDKLFLNLPSGLDITSDRSQVNLSDPLIREYLKKLIYFSLHSNPPDFKLLNSLAPLLLANSEDTLKIVDELSKETKDLLQNLTQYQFIPATLNFKNIKELKGKKCVALDPNLLNLLNIPYFAEENFQEKGEIIDGKMVENSVATLLRSDDKKNFGLVVDKKSDQREELIKVIGRSYFRGIHQFVDYFHMEDTFDQNPAKSKKSSIVVKGITLTPEECFDQVNKLILDFFQLHSLNGNYYSHKSKIKEQLCKNGITDTKLKILADFVDKAPIPCKHRYTGDYGEMIIGLFQFIDYIPESLLEKFTESKMFDHLMMKQCKGSILYYLSYYYYKESNPSGIDLSLIKAILKFEKNDHERNYSIEQLINKFLENVTHLFANFDLKKDYLKSQRSQENLDWFLEPSFEEIKVKEKGEIVKFIQEINRYGFNLRASAKIIDNLDLFLYLIRNGWSSFNSVKKKNFVFFLNENIKYDFSDKDEYDFIGWVLSHAKNSEFSLSMIKQLPTLMNYYTYLKKNIEHRVLNKSDYSANREYLLNLMFDKLQKNLFSNEDKEIIEKLSKMKSVSLSNNHSPQRIELLKTLWFSPFEKLIKDNGPSFLSISDLQNAGFYSTSGPQTFQKLSEDKKFREIKGENIDINNRIIQSSIGQSLNHNVWPFEIIKNSSEAGAAKIEFNNYESGDTQILEIRDDGSGMAPEQLHYLYIPMFSSKLKSSEDINFGHGFFSLFSNPLISEVKVITQKKGHDKWQVILKRSPPPSSELMMSKMKVEKSIQTSGSGTQIFVTLKEGSKLLSAELAHIQDVVKRSLQRFPKLNLQINKKNYSSLKVDNYFRPENLLEESTIKWKGQSPLKVSFIDEHPPLLLYNRGVLGANDYEDLLHEKSSNELSHLIKKYSYPLSLNLEGNLAQTLGRNDFIEKETILNDIHKGWEKAHLEIVIRELLERPDLLERELPINFFLDLKDYPKNLLTTTPLKILKGKTLLDFKRKVSTVHKAVQPFEIKNFLRMFEENEKKLATIFAEYLAIKDESDRIQKFNGLSKTILGQDHPLISSLGSLNFETIKSGTISQLREENIPEPLLKTAEKMNRFFKILSQDLFNIPLDLLFYSEGDSTNSRGSLDLTKQAINFKGSTFAHFHLMVEKCEFDLKKISEILAVLTHGFVTSIEKSEKVDNEESFLKKYEEIYSKAFSLADPLLVEIYKAKFKEICEK